MCSSTAHHQCGTMSRCRRNSALALAPIQYFLFYTKHRHCGHGILQVRCLNQTIRAILALLALCRSYPHLLQTLHLQTQIAHLSPQLHFLSFHLLHSTILENHRATHVQNHTRHSHHRWAPWLHVPPLYRHHWIPSCTLVCQCNTACWYVSAAQHAGTSGVMRTHRWPPCTYLYISNQTALISDVPH